MAKRLVEIFTKEQLSGRYAEWRPDYAPPQALEKDDRPFDPRLDRRTRAPKKTGHVRNRDAFNASALWKTHIYRLLVKPPQSDTYRLPEDLPQAAEFLRKAATFEHNRTPAAFTRAAVLYISHNHGTNASWHYDIRDRNDTEMSHTFLCSNRPARYRIVAQRESWGMDGDGTFAPLYEAMPPWAKPDQVLDSQPMGEPYDITRHDSLCQHKGRLDWQSYGRTMMALLYTALDKDDLKRGRYDSPCFEGRTIPPSAKPEQAGKLLEKHLRRK